MNTIRELKQQEKYNNMLKRKNKEIERLKEQLNDEIEEELKQSEIMVKKQEEIERLHSIIKEVREYIINHREAVDERAEHIIYFLKDDFDEEDVLEILDKENK